MRRKGRQKKKYLGHRSFGRGNVKNRRGSGNRGGRGAAGLHKHKYSWVVKYAPNYFGKHGFHKDSPDIKIMHLYEIQQDAMHGKLEKKEGKHHLAFDGKILGTGHLSLPVHIKALAWSKRCEEKVKKAGGSLEKIGG